MSSCGIDDRTDLPVLYVRLKGRGEDAMRMDKRLRCAGRALGVRVAVDWDATQHGLPVITIDQQLVVDRLVDTMQLEQLLKLFIQKEEQRP